MNLPTLTISASKGWLDQKERFSKNQAGKEQKNYTLLSSGELSYNHGNSKLAKYGTVFVLRDYTEALVPRIYHSFKMKNNNSACFIEYLFATKKLDRELRKLVTSGARLDGLLNISYDTFMSMFIKIPEFEEQFKIAKFLKKIDDTIALYQHQLELYKKIKITLTHDLSLTEESLISKLRFTDFSGKWHKYKLGELGKFEKSNIDPQKNSNIIFNEYSMPSYDNGRLPNRVFGKSMKSTRLQIRSKVLLINKLNVRQKRIWLVDNPKVNSVASSEFMPFVSNNVDLNFLRQLMITNKVTRALESISSGTSNSQKRITPSDLKNFSINLPVDINEQQKLGELLTEIDNILSSINTKIKQLKVIKKYCLQKLFI